MYNNYNPNVYVVFVTTIVLVLLLLSSTSLVNGQDYDCSFTASSPVTDVSALQDGTFLLRHNIHPIDKVIHIELEYSGIADPVWLGLSFSTTTSMLQNIAMIGFPTDNTVVKHSLTSKVTSGVLPIDSSTLTGTSTTNDGTKTIMKFIKPLEETGETTIVSNADNIILVAVGTDSTLNYHAYRDDFTINLSNICPVLAAGTTAAPVSTPAPITPTAPVPVAAPIVVPAPFAEGGGAGVVNLGNGRIERTISLLDGDVSLVLITDSVQEALTVTMKYAGVGWLAFAISDGDVLMPNSQGVMVFPTSTSGIAEKWDIGNGKVESVVTKVTDTTRQATLINATYTQSGTETIMTFTKPYVDGTEFPITVSPGNLNYFIYAVGSSNDFGYHSKRGGFTIDLSDTAEGGGNIDTGTSPNTKSLWMVHGILMFISWSILVPLAVCTALLRNFIPFFTKNGNWFQIHRALNSVAVLCTIIGFAIAVHNINEEGGSSATHFTTNRHQKMGLVIFIFAMVQAISGMFRPHLPHATTTAKPATTDVHAASEVMTDTIEDGQPPKATVDDAVADDTPLKKSPQRIAFEIQHKLMGTIAMILGWFNVDTGIGFYQLRYNSDGGNKHMDTIPWAITASIVTVTAVCLVYHHFLRHKNAQQ